MSSKALPAPAKHLFRHLFEQASLGIAVEDLDGKLLLANPALCSMLGYTEKELCSMSCSEFANPEDSQEDWALFQQLRAGVIDHYSLEKRYVRRDGAPLWGRLNVSLSREDDGGTPLVFAFVEEITERKLAEHELARTAERLQLAVEAGKSVGWEWDLESGQDSWFGDLQTMFGIPSDRFVGRPEDFFRYVHPDDRQLVSKAVADAREGRKPYQAEFRVVRIDGVVRWVTASGRFYYRTNGDPERMLGMAADITDRKQVEQRLREYEKAVEGSEEMIAVVDRKYRYLIANRRFLNLRNMTREQVIGHLVPEVLNRGVFESIVKERLDECFTGKVVRFEMKYTYPDFGERELLVSYFPIEGAKGIDRVACIMQDVTERKRAEEALRETEARERARVKELETILDAVPLPILIAHDPDCRRITGNQAAHEQLRVPAGRNFSLSATPEERPPFRQVKDGMEIPADLLPIQQTVATGKPVYGHPITVLFADGTIREEIVNVLPLLDETGKPRGAVAASVDMTEQRQAERALRESEDKLRLLLDSTAEAIYGIDLEHRCTFCNPACLRALGYERVEELVGKNMHDLMHHHRADGTLFPAEECRIHRVLQASEGNHSEDEVLWRANGTSFPAEYWSYPQRRGEQVVGAVVAFVDITQRKLAEAALANVSRKLIEAQEQERTRIARELHDDIGQRVAMLAIEIEQLPRTSSALPTELTGRMRELWKQTCDIATDVQSLSHELHSSKLQYLGITAAIRSFCKEFGEQQKVEIDFASHDLPSPLSPDTSLCIFRVLQEALHNSVKHSGVRHFEVRLWGRADELHLTVHDSGVGFDTETAKTGHGLGLISMEERLKLVNGTLSIESQPKSGTTIHARVPLSWGRDSIRAAG